MYEVQHVHKAKRDRYAWEYRDRVPLGPLRRQVEFFCQGRRSLLGTQAGMCKGIMASSP